LKKNEPVSFECNVDRFGNYKFKVVEPRQVSTLLHRTFGADRVMPVYFDQPPPAHDQFRIVRDGILVGLRRYRFWAFKDSGKEDFKKRNKAGGKIITLYVSSCLFLFYLYFFIADWMCFCINYTKSVSLQDFN
jgi:hypothetical protein